MNALIRTAVATAYRTQQLALRAAIVTANNTARRLAGNRATFDEHEIELIRRRYWRLLDTDLDNANEGLYPHKLLFQFPVRQYARAFPRLLLDVPRTMRRYRRRDFRDLPDLAERDDFPAYYRRNFHWQTDGYFSDHSASIYDLGVELVFAGVADVMRRQVIPPMTRFLSRAKDSSSILDVACGTGRTLGMISATHPSADLSGVDLSPHYVSYANRRLGTRARLRAANAEQLPFADASFDIVTSTYLFHELPKDARRRVLAEMVRCLRPGGLLVLEDSVQTTDSPELTPFVDRFSSDFHEPYYRGYQNDPLEDAVGAAGLDVTEVASHFLSKVVVAERPPAL